MRKILPFAFSLLLLGTLALPACKKKINDKKPIGPTFDLDKFDAELKASIQPAGAIGWGYIITQNGLYVKGGAFGKARNDADGSRTFTLNRKVNIASVSKWFTAIAVMQLLEKRNLATSNTIDVWLPPSWSKGPGASTVTFAELLGHTSGFSSYNTQFSRTLSYSGIQRMIDTGVVRPKSYQYLNANYALFRILIPSLWRGLPGAPNIPTLDSASTEAFYIQYMQENVFEPVGLTGIICLPEDRSIATMYYNIADGESTGGAAYGDWTPICGGGGFYMTTMEIARMLAYYRHTEVLMSKEQRKRMEDGRFGYEPSNSREVRGTYYYKNGSIANGSPSAGGQGTYEQICIFPNGVECVVMFNTQGMTFAGGETFIGNAIYDAYNKAWVE